VSRALAVLALALLAAGCSDAGPNAQPRPAAPPAVPVSATTVERMAVPLQVAAVGTVQAYTTVAVKSQVAGQVVRVHFTEGHDVKRGDLLFTIDPRPMEAAVRQMDSNVARDTAQLRQAEAALAQRQAEVHQAQANLQRDRAQLENARAQERRYGALVEQELVAREQYEQMRTQLAALEATVQADRAAIDTARASARAAAALVDNARAAIKAGEAVAEAARLQLGYTTIRAPIDGRTGNLLVQAGNVVKVAEDTPLVVIAQVRPVHVSFAVPEQHLPAIRKFRAAGPLTVDAVVDGGERTVAGAVTFVNNTVDAGTGTIQLKATFPNTDDALWPGQFVDVALTLTTEQALVVPPHAVQAGQQGAFVFVVKPDLTVESRAVRTGRRLAHAMVVEQGLAAGERVVTDGQLRLRPGARVEIKAQAAR
jgi:multidrug efflux system membrane fusion protein